ncbi:tail protein X [Escherichia coli]
MKVRAHQYDTVDALCWRHYGRTQGVTEQVLKANPGLAEYGPFLPHGLQVELPDIPTPISHHPIYRMALTVKA